MLIEVVVDDIFSLDEWDLDEAIEHLSSLKEAYEKTHANLILKQDNDGCLLLWGEREETEQEKTRRETRQRELIKRKEEQEFKQYNELKKKFEKCQLEKNEID